MSKFTFLEEEQIFGDNAIDIIKKRGTKSAVTDFSILLGAYVSDYYNIDGDSSLEGRTGWYWTKSDDGDKDARVVDSDGLVITAMLTLVMVESAQLYRSPKSV